MLQAEAMKAPEYHSLLVMNSFSILLWFFPPGSAISIWGKKWAGFREIRPASFLDVDGASGVKRQPVLDFALPFFMSHLHPSITGTLPFPPSFTPDTCLLRLQGYRHIYLPSVPDFPVWSTLLSYNFFSLAPPRQFKPLLLHAQNEVRILILEHNDNVHKMPGTWALNVGIIITLNKGHGKPNCLSL